MLSQHQLKQKALVEEDLNLYIRKDGGSDAAYMWTNRILELVTAIDDAQSGHQLF